MSISGASILNAVAVKLFDPDFVRWSVFELFQDMNDGQREIVYYKPDANTVNEAITLTDDSIKQTIAGCQYLFDVIENVGSGRLISLMDKQLLSTAAPTWHSTTVNEAVGVKYYSYDEKDKANFYVYPKPVKTTDDMQVNVLYSKLPDDVAYTSTADISMTISQVSGDIQISEEYKNALVDYILFRAFSKDSPHSSSARAQLHYQSFANALGLRSQIEDKENPNNHRLNYSRSEREPV